MDKLQEAWEAYRLKALPSEVSEVHLQLTRDAFYAGAEFAEWKPAIMPPLPNDTGWLDRMQAGSGRSDQGRPLDNAPAIADDPMAAERERYLQDE